MIQISWLRRILAVSFLIPLAFVWRFFAGERFYAHTPIHPALGELPAAVDWAALTFIALLLVWVSLTKLERLPLGLFLVFSFVFSLWDQSRWMPYFYQYFFMMLAVYSFRPDEDESGEVERVKNTLRIICASIWIWSGLHKIGAIYVLVGYPWMMKPFLDILPEALHGPLLLTSFLSPLVESGGALCLFFPKTRNFGVLLLTAMHVVILVIFGPAGLNWNPSVWSWNVAMICFLWLLFFRARGSGWSILFGSGKLFGDKIVHRTVMTMFLLLPALNNAGYWDDFLSHCLYSWNTREAEIVVEPEAESLLPAELRKEIRREAQPPVIPFLEWSFRLFNSPPYHSYRVFHSVFGKLCEHTEGSQGITLRIFEKPDLLTAKHEIISYKCTPLPGSRELVRIYPPAKESRSSITTPPSGPAQAPAF